MVLVGINKSVSLVELLAVRSDRLVGSFELCPVKTEQGKGKEEMQLKDWMKMEVGRTRIKKVRVSREA